MKSFVKLAMIAVLAFSSSCALLFNKSELEVGVKSSPSGANIFINGKYYGRTPAVLSLPTKDYKVILSKEGYGSTQFDIKSWVTYKGRDGGDGARCKLDMLTAIFPWSLYSLQYSGKCAEFKQKEYSITIPHLGTGAGLMTPNARSMMGAGRQPADLINYYYQQDVKNNGRRR